MKILTGFALKEEYKRLEFVGDKLAEIDSLIDWKPFRTILESMYSNKIISGGRSETDVIIMLKCLFYSSSIVFLTLSLRNSVLIKFPLENFLAFRNTFWIAPLYGYSWRGLSRMANKKKFGESYKTNFMLLV
jgi:IS5 family transposase